MQVNGDLNPDLNGQDAVADILNGGGNQARITVGTTPVLAAVNGSSNRANRKLLILNTSSSNIFYGFTSNVTTTTGIPLTTGAVLSLAVGPETNVYLVRTVSGGSVQIAEVS